MNTPEQIAVLQQEYAARAMKQDLGRTRLPQ